MEYLKTEHGVFTNNEFTGQTAEEVYEEWLNGKVAPIENITIEEQLEQLKIENAKLKGKIINLGTQKVMKLAFMIMLVITEMMMNMNK